MFCRYLVLAGSVRDTKRKPLIFFFGGGFPGFDPHALILAFDLANWGVLRHFAYWTRIKHILCWLFGKSWFSSRLADAYFPRVQAASSELDNCRVEIRDALELTERRYISIIFPRMSSPF